MSFKKRWQPSKSARREFAEKMNNDVDFAAAYNQRKSDRADKRRAGSNFDYSSAGGEYVPTKAQFDFCLRNNALFVTSEQKNAQNMVMAAYTCNEKTHHDNIHIVNELIRSNPDL